ncbi:phosphoribosyltransferase family protein [Bacillus sp. RAR_GA_16]|uniref:phosphoribosyltransferase family protein n=1 Tax=Bacillus sp. RAR_GA_16 TaxID=2876774 RepID=UPI001CD01B81|nr:phosphoribosyltransferase family protein [Bacillus sp. RAR_GA_16]MCA0173640.1 phosphoribosyltransferase family protein [Bacillus sp. RAR_GA_16]
MTSIISSKSLQKQYHIPILSDMSVNLTITENVLNIPLDELFAMAARINKKRGFLFVSKILGKHLPVNPYLPLLASGLLAATYYERVTGDSIHNLSEIRDGFLSHQKEDIQRAYQLLQSHAMALQEPPIVIGFAETATALGHGVFDCFQESYYIHTTRENVGDQTPEFNFKEEHSHAVDQRCYANHSILEKTYPVVLVDDEITTGKTCLNIIREIHAKYPRDHYAILSLLDWRSHEHIAHYEALEKELGITIRVESLLKGTIVFEGKPLEKPMNDFHLAEERHMKGFINRIDLSKQFQSLPEYHYLSLSGRFGICEDDKAMIEKSCQQAAMQLNKQRYGGKTLCLGTGEFMYIPMKVASYLTGDISYHSTTRSPIQPVQLDRYAIKEGFTFPNPEDPTIQHYVYNIPKGEYDEVFVFFEKNVSTQDTMALATLLKEREISTFHIVTCS